MSTWQRPLAPCPANRGERLGSSSRSIRAIGTPWGSGGGLEEAFSDFLGHHADLLEGASRRSVSGTLFPHRPRRTKLLVGALIQRLRHCKPPPSSVFERRRQVGGPAPRRAFPSVQHLVASVASQGRFPVATGLSLCLISQLCAGSRQRELWLSRPFSGLCCGSSCGATPVP